MKSEDPGPAADLEDLKNLIGELVAGVTDPNVTLGIETDGYGKCVEAMWRASYLAFNYVAGELGVTGFQASMAALHAYGRVMNITGPFMMTKLEDALYPQYNLFERLQEFVSDDDAIKWLGDQAEKNLADRGGVPAVREHWELLVIQRDNLALERAAEAGEVNDDEGK